MRAVIQRVLRAGVAIGGEEAAAIGRGFLILLGVKRGDTKDDADYLAEKCAGLRVFGDQNGRMNLSAADVGGSFLVVPNFTLYGDCRRGKRPSFTDAAGPEEAVPLYEYFVRRMKDRGLPVKTGVFGAHMEITLTNDGPVTIFIDTELV